ncbi:MAG: hypothetical protein ACE5GI_04115 [Candidatus Aminicenantales bacterium]
MKNIEASGSKDYSNGKIIYNKIKVNVATVIVKDVELNYTLCQKYVALLSRLVKSEQFSDVEMH